MPSAVVLGADVGGTKTHVAVADSTGRVLGFGRSGPGNPQSVGQAGLLAVLKDGLSQALRAAGLTAADIGAAGFGVAGYDWPSERPAFLETLGGLGLGGPVGLDNDAALGLLAGAADGWGVCVVAGTGCNCRGWDPGRRREGRVTGYGLRLGEGAGASELVERAMQLVSQVWSGRRPPAGLAEELVRHAGARDLDDLIQGYSQERYAVGPQAAPLVLAAAEAGDPLAQELVRWAGAELAEMAKAVIRQLELEAASFDVVLVGSLVSSDSLLRQTFAGVLRAYAPGARIRPLGVPPVLGALVLAYERAGQAVSAAMRQRLADSLPRD